MNTSLQTNKLSVPINQPEIANQSTEVISAEIPDDTNIDPDVVVPASPVTEKQSAVNSQASKLQTDLFHK